MNLHAVGPVRVAQLEADVAIDDDVALDDAALGVEPQEHGAEALARSALNPDEHVVTDDPVLGVHHVDCGDVVALGDVGRVVAEPFRAVVVE